MENFVNPSVECGKTTYPQTAGEQERFGIRFDYDVVVIREGIECHMFKMQVNARKILPVFLDWRDKKGTDAVMARVYVKKGGTSEDVRAALDAAREAFKDAKASSH